MKDQSPKKDSNYIRELRSEKVRNIVGPMPPTLIGYGIAAICMALVIVIVVCAFLPFRKVVSGVAYISNFYHSDNNINHVTAQLKFDKSNNVANPQGCNIICNKAGYAARGIILTYNPARTELGEYIAELEFDNKTDLAFFESTETDFEIILSETTVLNRLLSTIKIKVY